MKDGRKINPEMLVGVSAVVIGVCALGVSLYEAALMREEQRSAVLPLVELSRSVYTAGEDTDRWRLQINVGHMGIGPARIADFKVSVDGVAHGNWQSAMRALLHTDERIEYGHSTINGRTIPPDTEIAVFDLNDNKESFSADNWRLGIDYDIGDDTFAYLYAATGSKAGSFGDGVDVSSERGSASRSSRGC